MWSVGDQRPIEWNGVVAGSGLQGTFYTKIADLDYLPNVTTDGKHNILLKAPYALDATQLAFCNSLYAIYTEQNQTGFCMNPRYSIDNIKDSNKGGWSRSFANNVIAGQLLSALPEEWHSVVYEATIYTDNVGNGTGSVTGNVTATKNKMFFLATYEVFGSSDTMSNTHEHNYQRQLLIYRNGTKLLHYKHDAVTTAVHVCLRSPTAVSDSGFTSITNGAKVSNRTASIGSGLTSCCMIAA